MAGVFAALLALSRLEISKDERLTEHAGQHAERYSKAIELLASDDVSTQLGGLYSLEALARPDVLPWHCRGASQHLRA